MKLDEAGQLAMEVVAKYGPDADKPSVHLANALLVVLPVARAASMYEATRCAVLLGKDTHAELQRRGEDLENAVDTMRAALEGK